MEEITSASNSRVKRLVLLRQKAKERRQSQSFVIEGERLVLDAPAEYLEEVYVTRGALEKSGERLAPLSGKITLLSEEAMAKASDTMSPQGILAVARQPRYSTEDLLGRERRESLNVTSIEHVQTAASVLPHSAKSALQILPQRDIKVKTPLLLILEDIQDPGNLGTMFRTAEAAGATGILMSRGTVDVFNPKTVRSTMSSIFRMPFAVEEDFHSALRDLQEKGIRLFAACLDESRSYEFVDGRGACGFLIGNEGNGLTKETIQLADERVHIPMEGRIESLNAAMSAGILLYEAARQRHSHGPDGPFSC